MPLPPAPAPLVSLASSVSLTAVDARALEAFALGWARALPLVTLVPAFGLRALPPPARVILALALAAPFVPSGSPVTVVPLPGEPLAVRLVLAIAEGLPLAIATAAPLWAATMSGGIVDTLRSAGDGPGSAVTSGRAGSFGVLFSIFASSVFLVTGGPARAGAALATAGVGPSWVRVAHDLAAGVALATSIAAPLLGAAIVVEITAALIARVAAPAQVHALLAPLRSAGLLAASALVLDRIAEGLALAAR